MIVKSSRLFRVYSVRGNVSRRTRRKSSAFGPGPGTDAGAPGWSRGSRSRSALGPEPDDDDALGGRYFSIDWTRAPALPTLELSARAAALDHCARRVGAFACGVKWNYTQTLKLKVFLDEKQIALKTNYRLLWILMCRRHSKDLLTGAENGLV